MKILKKLEVVFLTILLLGMSSFARPVSADTDKGAIQFSHVLKDDLTDEQRSQIKDGNPTGTVDGDEDIILVYEKDAVTPPTSSQGNKVLPKAGSVSAPILVVLGLLLLSVTTFLLKRYKLSGLLLVLLMTSSFALPVQAAEKLLAETVVVSYDNGQAIRHTPQSITGHHYVGYIRQVKEQAKGTVLAEYVDENGTKLQADVAVLSDSPVGVAYTATKPDTIDYNGKTYKLFKTADNETGTVVAGVTKVTYVYKVSDAVVPSVYKANLHVTIQGIQTFKELGVYYKGKLVATYTGEDYGTANSKTNQLTGKLPILFDNLDGSRGVYLHDYDELPFYGYTVDEIITTLASSGTIGQAIPERPQFSDFTFLVDGVGIENIESASKLSSFNVVASDDGGYILRLENSTEEKKDTRVTYHSEDVVDTFTITFTNEKVEYQSGG